MRTKLLILLTYLLISLPVHAQDFITLPGATNVERSNLSEEEVARILERANQNQNERLDAAEVEQSLVVFFYMRLRYEPDLAKAQFELSDEEIDRLVDRIDTAIRAVSEINTTRKNLMCTQWRSSALSGQDRTIESIQNYDNATEDTKGSAYAAFLAAVSDMPNLVDRSKAIKISEFLGEHRVGIARSGNLYTLSDTIRNSSDSEEFLTDLCGGQQ